MDNVFDKRTYYTLPVAMDRRASHQVYTNGCVKIRHKGYTISIAADGGDVLLENSNGTTLRTISVSHMGTADAIAALVAVVNVMAIDDSSGASPTL